MQFYYTLYRYITCFDVLLHIKHKKWINYFHEINVCNKIEEFAYHIKVKTTLDYFCFNVKEFIRPKFIRIFKSVQKVLFLMVQVSSKTIFILPIMVILLQHNSSYTKAFFLFYYALNFIDFHHSKLLLIWNFFDALIASRKTTNILTVSRTTITNKKTTNKILKAAYQRIRNK